MKKPERDAKSTQSLVILRAAMLPLLLIGCTSIRPDLPVGDAAYATLAATDAQRAREEETVSPFDTLRINVFGEADLSVDEVRVDNSGRIPFPLVGPVEVQGLTSSQISQEIQTRLARNYLVNPQVTVFIVKSAAQRFTVEGDVETPGVFDIGSDTTLIQAMALAQGPTDTARLSEILVFRNVGNDVYAAQFDLRAIRVGAAPDPQIRPGDRIVVSRSALRGFYKDVLVTAPLLTTLFIRVL